MTRKKKARTKVIVYPAWCKGCGICVAFCPKNVFEMGPDGKSRVAREQDCINCGFCELHCPDFAVSVESAEESASVPDRPRPQASNGEASPEEPLPEEAAPPAQTRPEPSEQPAPGAKQPG